MKQTIRLTESELKTIIKEVFLEDFNGTQSNHETVSNETMENVRIKQEGKEINLGPDWGVWKVKGGWANPPKDCFIWRFGPLPFPDNYYVKSDDVIIEYIKNEVIKRYQNAYIRDGYSSD